MRELIQTLDQTRGLAEGINAAFYDEDDEIALACAAADILELLSDRLRRDRDYTRVGSL